MNAERDRQESLPPRPVRWLLLGLAYLFVGLGMAGIALPGVPTVPFLLLAAWTAGHSSPRFYRWLYNHPLLSPA